MSSGSNPFKKVEEYGKGLFSSAINMSGLNKTDTSPLNNFNMTPEERAAQNKLMAQLSNQAMGGASPLSDMANKQAMALASTQSRNASNPFLGIKAAAQAQQQGQAEAQLGAQQQLSDMLNAQKQTALQATQAQIDARAGDRDRRAAFIGQLSSSAGQASGGKGSDENLKENKKAISDSGGKIDEFLKSLDPYTFEYKDKNLGKKQVGILAQDLEKTEVGAAAVREVDGNKVVDPSHLTMPILAAQSEMIKRIKELENKVKKRS